MGILGIENRTENWKTAYEFAPFFRDAELRLKLAQRLSRSSETEESQATLELFWKGGRDYLAQQEYIRKTTAQDVARAYNQLFGPLGERGSLRDMITPFCRPTRRGGLAPLQPDNYVASGEGQVNKLFSEFRNIEIDIVLESTKGLFVGEAKFESNLGGRGSLILVHQLIRQYVMVSILLAMLGSTKEVVPFIVWDKSENDSQEVQVEFMKALGWLNPENVLEWADIEHLRS